MEICNNYNNFKTPYEVNTNFEVVKSWWHSFGITSRIDLENLNHWFSFWHFWIHQWRNLARKVLFFCPYFISYLFTNLTRFCLIIHVQCMIVIWSHNLMFKIKFCSSVQGLTIEEDANMLISNLFETIHNT